MNPEFRKDLVILKDLKEKFSALKKEFTVRLSEVLEGKGQGPEIVRTVLDDVHLALYDGSSVLGYSFFINTISGKYLRDTIKDTSILEELEYLY